VDWGNKLQLMALKALECNGNAQVTGGSPIQINLKLVVLKDLECNENFRWTGGSLYFKGGFPRRALIFGRQTPDSILQASSVSFHLSCPC
jgi:hypothetical protein